MTTFHGRDRTSSRHCEFVYVLNGVGESGSRRGRSRVVKSRENASGRMRGFGVEEGVKEGGHRGVCMQQEERREERKGREGGRESSEVEVRRWEGRGFDDE